MGHDVAASPPKVQKKLKGLPFKPTALRRAAAQKAAQSEESKEAEDNGLDLFRRSKEMAPRVEADLERRVKKRQAELEAARRRSEAATRDKRPRECDDDEIVNHEQPQDLGTGVIGPQSPAQEAGNEDLDHPLTQNRSDRTSELVTPPPSKRSRLGSGSSSRRPPSSAELDDPFPDASPSRRVSSRINSRASNRTTKMDSVTPNPSAAIICLDSDSDSGDVPIRAPSFLPVRRRSSSIVEVVDSPSATKHSAKEPPPPPAEVEDEEDEFAEYVRRAEQQRAREQALLKANSDEPQKKESIHIMVSSEIPGARGLLLKYLFTKPLRQVRQAWISHQQKHNVPIPQDQYADVVLTWRKKKVYNSSTLLSLGIRPQADGRAIADTHGLEGFKDSRNQVHMEAWTPDLFQEMERQEEIRRKRDAGELSDSEEDPPELPQTFKIFLKARDIEPFGLTVRPETTVDSLVTCYRTQQNIGSGRDVSLWWDGERLEEHITMDDAEIEALDTIEVHIR